MKAVAVRPGLADLFTTWLVMGVQSFGGGSSTFYLIHKVCIERHYLEEEEFVRDWALSQIAPGINLVKFTMMIGYRLRGWPGLVAASAGMLVPSAAVTVVMTAAFATVRNLPLVQATMKGVLPATIGLSLAMGIQMAQPLFARARQEGGLRLALHVVILLGAALVMRLTQVSPVVILLAAGAVTMLLLAIVPVSAAGRGTRRGTE